MAFVLVWQLKMAELYSADEELRAEPVLQFSFSLKNKGIISFVSFDTDAKFSRKYRLIHKSDFQSVFSKSKRTVYKNLLALYCVNKMFYARLGLIIGKKYARYAVERNLIRRIIRESFRHQKETLKGLDIVVLLRTECTPLDKKALRDNSNQLWRAILSKGDPGVSSDRV